MSYKNLQEIQTKRRELDKQLDEITQKLSEANQQLETNPSPENADEVRRLNHVFENIEVARKSAIAIEKKFQSTGESERIQAEKKRLAGLVTKADQKRADILKTVERLNSQFAEYEQIAEDHRKIAAQFGEFGIRYKSENKLIFALSREVTSWSETFHRYQRNKEIEKKNQVQTVKLTPLQKAVHAERYHDPNEMQRRVRLVNNEGGPESRPDNIRIG